MQRYLNTLKNQKKKELCKINLFTKNIIRDEFDRCRLKLFCISISFPKLVL